MPGRLEIYADVLTIIALTWTEILRRRTPLVTFAVALLLTVGAFIPLQGKLLLLPPEEANQIYASLYIFFATNITKFFSAILSIALTAGAISAEWERGTLSTILPKPLSRFAIYSGKWIGLFSFVAVSLFVWDIVIYCVAHYRAPHETFYGVLTAFPFLLLYPALFVTLALFFSTFGAFPLASGLTVLWTGIGWAEGTFFLLHRVFDVNFLMALSKAAGYMMPIGRMSRAVADGMGELPGLPQIPSGPRGILTGGIFGTIENGPFDLPYILLYGICFFAAGAIFFARKDV